MSEELSYFKFFRGEVTLHPNWTSTYREPALLQEDILEYERKYFWGEPHRALPRPGMYLNKPCFYGGMTPLGMFEDDTLERIVNSKLRYETVRFSGIRRATDREFQQHFRRLYEGRRIEIRNQNFYLDGIRLPETTNH